MNKLQEVQLSLLKDFITVCDKLNIKYFMVCGSALGAVKYKGFIPWDDDIDVALLREDYEVFCKEGVKLLPKDVFLQNYRTDPKYPLLMSKLRNNKTTFIEKIYCNIDMNHGVYIDVFPIDGYPKKISEKKALKKEKVLFDIRRLVVCNYDRFSRNNIIHVKAIIAYILHKLFGCYQDTSKVISRFDNVVSSYSCENSDIWCNHGNWQGELEYAHKWHYGEGTWAEFEGLKVRIPENYDAYLTQKYGDWRADLPVEQQKGHHSYTVCDLERPYSEYLNFK